MADHLNNKPYGAWIAIDIAKDFNAVLSECVLPPKRPPVIVQKGHALLVGQHSGSFSKAATQVNLPTEYFRPKAVFKDREQ